MVHQRTDLGSQNIVVGDYRQRGFFAQGDEDDVVRIVPDQVGTSGTSDVLLAKKQTGAHQREHQCNGNYRHGG